jgi:hypothetical protein
MKNIIRVCGKIFFITFLSFKNANIPVFFGTSDESEVVIAPLGVAVHIFKVRGLIGSSPVIVEYENMRIAEKVK